ncbi:MAG TPA: nucleoside deaminase [Polyangiaceae bacterium]|nr:nucleoside deaminase [Polyangiaceae bacterium]
MTETEVVWRIPEWLPRELELSAPRHDDDSKMRLAIEVAARNVVHGGGPFGAVIFDASTGHVVAAGANWVIEQRCSLLHAEVAAIAFAQRRLNTHSLAVGNYELVASSDPCAQCLGALVWSGVRRILCGAQASDAEAIGFDEGPRREDWVSELERRGIRVTRGLLAGEARAVLQSYALRGGPIYNGPGVSG